MPWYVCNAHGCTDRHPSAPAKAGHLVEKHGVSATDALSEARTLAVDSVQPAPDPPRAAADVAQTRVKPDDPPAREEPTMATNKPCKLCDRRKKAALGPCGWHGGKGATGGGKPSKRKAGKPRPANGARPMREARPAPETPERARPEVSMAERMLKTLDEQIVDAKAEVRALERLRAAVGA